MWRWTVGSTGVEPGLARGRALPYAPACATKSRLHLYKRTKTQTQRRACVQGQIVTPCFTVARKMHCTLDMFANITAASCRCVIASWPFFQHANTKKKTKSSPIPCHMSHSHSQTCVRDHKQCVSGIFTVWSKRVRVRHIHCAV